MATWRKGQPWRVVNGLQALNGQMRERYARAAAGTPATAWGSIGDDEHDADSDHYPHFYSALGPTAVVCARDFPHAPALGLHFGAVAEALRLSRDPRIGYVIFAGRVFSGHVVGSTPAFEWRKHTGEGHYDHGHVSTVHTALADDTRPWALPGAAESMTGTDMELNDKSPWTQQFTSEASDLGLWLGGTVGQQLQYVREDAYYARLFAKRADSRIAALTAVIEGLSRAIEAGGGSVDTATILAGVDEKLAALAAEQRDAVADLGEGGAAQVRADTDGRGD